MATRPAEQLGDTRRGVRGRALDDHRGPLDDEIVDDNGCISPRWLGNPPASTAVPPIASIEPRPAITRVETFTIHLQRPPWAG
ncbi:MAG: hypothetical protein AB7P03_08185 [Kofleriaceae bacterium]